MKQEEENEEIQTELIIKEQEVINDDDKRMITPRINNSVLTPVESNRTMSTYMTKIVNELKELQSFGEYVITSGLCPLKKASDVSVAILSGRELGLSPIVSINNIFPISNKPAISTHIIKGLLLSNDVLFKKTLDYKPVYIYLKEVKNDKGEEKQVPVGRGYAEDKPLELKLSNSPVDYITEYEFSRFKLRANGKYEELIIKSNFSIMDGKTAGLLENPTWQKYPKRMLDARAFIIGAREIASDIIFGMYSINELADTSKGKVKYNITENLEESILED